ncbi:MAG: hypothetical protein KY461_07710 [Actinobacteria bacterium]|nr:hypothetical protein [Actinomycetota bacterium]
MFVQVFEGEVDDAEAVHDLFERWAEQQLAEARGFVGGVAGVTDEGRLVSVVRFEDEASARENSDRPGQGAWWSRLEPHFTSGPTFAEATEADTWFGGLDADAGFVQIMRGKVDDLEAVRAMGAEMEDWTRQHRPDVTGGLAAWHDDGTFTQVVCFSDEAAAREGEAGAGGEGPEGMDELFADVRYHDLREPWHLST